MKTLFINSSSNIQFSPLENKIELYDSRGSVFTLNDGELSILSYSNDKPIGFHIVNNQRTTVLLRSDARHGDSKLAESSKIYFTPTLSLLENKYGVQYALFWSLVQKNSFENLYSANYRDLETSTRYIVTVDLDTGASKAGVWTPEGMRNPQFVIFDEGYDHQGTSLSKGNGSLDFLWTYRNSDPLVSSDQSIRYEKYRKIVLSGGAVIASLGSARNERENEMVLMYDGVEETHTEPDPYFTDGHLFGLDTETGAKKWLNVFDYQVEDFVLLPNGKLCVSSERKLYMLNPENGVIEKEIDSNIRKTERIETVSMTLLVHKDLLFLFSYKDCAFQIRNATTLKLLREVDAREYKWHFAKYRPTLADDLVFLPIELGYSEIAGGAILVIDTNDIYSEIQVEEAPSFIETLPSKQHHGPIKVSVDDPDWGKVLRFLERRLLELVFICTGRPQGRYFKPRSVELTYTGYEESTEFITEKMEIFKERFARYLADPHIPGIGIAPVEVNYKLVLED